MHPVLMYALLASGGHGGRGKGALWILGWIVVVAALVALTISLIRRRRRDDEEHRR
ncbi:MAG TPA: hypothetical protein VH373_14240 [Jatrophihabitantaceae bacterium]